MIFKAILRKSKKYYLIPHLFFWLISIVLFTVALVYTRGDFNIYDINIALAVNILITIGFLAVSVYINLLWLIPVFFNQRRYWLFFILEIANILLFILLNFVVSYFFEGGKHPNFFSEIIAELILVLLFLIVSTLLKVMRDSVNLQDVELRMKEVEKQKIEAELKALKAQIDPHFFFNTLNSLYSLTLDKSEKAPELILKLSDLMRFVIYESKDDLVPMGKQLDFLQSYIYLERLRTDESLVLDFEIRGENLQIKTAPLLYIAFIENAFKHGAKSRQEHPFIHIIFDLEKSDRVGFMIKNNKEANPEKSLNGGIGLTNVTKRLELLYPGKHELVIHETDTIFSVELTVFVL
ncbi:MAG: sensor histidine kinase [Bacteroidales bacterium]|jgi:sensor histidine kinase YesM|nr:sensor histidine kinase [Bacteroidales bacterium]